VSSSSLSSPISSHYQPSSSVSTDFMFVRSNATIDNVIEEEESTFGQWTTWPAYCHERSSAVATSRVPAPSPALPACPKPQRPLSRSHSYIHTHSHSPSSSPPNPRKASKHGFPPARYVHQTWAASTSRAQPSTQAPELTASILPPPARHFAMQPARSSLRVHPSPPAPSPSPRAYLCSLWPVVRTVPSSPRHPVTQRPALSTRR
jgi:hypothetical protein